MIREIPELSGGSVSLFSLLSLGAVYLFHGRGLVSADFFFRFPSSDKSTRRQHGVSSSPRLKNTEPPSSRFASSRRSIPMDNSNSSSTPSSSLLLHPLPFHRPSFPALGLSGYNPLQTSTFSGVGDLPRWGEIWIEPFNI